MIRERERERERDVLPRAICPVLGDISSESGVSSEFQWGGEGDGCQLALTGQTDSFLVRHRVRGSFCVLSI